jgi:phenylacetic acid degradation operon negative regulatory protein
MNCSSMIFTLFGAHLRNYGNYISNRALSEIMEVFGFTPEAVRAAAFRMVKQGWLERSKEGRNTFYTLTMEGKSRVQQGILRIFDIDQGQWNGTWHILTYSIPEKKRNIRDELRRELVWLGFGSISNGTWITPWDLKGAVEPFVQRRRLNGLVEMFAAQHEGYSTNRAMVERCWNFDQIQKHYEIFLKKWEERFSQLDLNTIQSRESFIEQTLLIHDWRKFLHLDPKLPFELLPDNWIGKQVLQFFLEHYGLLNKPSRLYLESVLD